MRVLVPMDGSEQSWAAFEYALEQFPDATLVCLRVVNPVQAGYGIGMEGNAAAADEVMDARRETAEEMFDEVRERAAAAGADLETRIEVGRPARTIEEVAEAVDHVVVGSHGREGIARVLLGSVAENVIRRSPVPVTVVR
jgi:nucleotide-binding universal stress UspA family protein